MLESLFNNVEVLQLYYKGSITVTFLWSLFLITLKACNFNKKGSITLLSCEIWKFLITPIMKNICEWRLLCLANELCTSQVLRNSLKFSDWKDTQKSHNLRNRINKEYLICMNLTKKYYWCSKRMEGKWTLQFFSIPWWDKQRNNN